MVYTFHTFQVKNEEKKRKAQGTPDDEQREGGRPRKTEPAIPIAKEIVALEEVPIKAMDFEIG